MEAFEVSWLSLSWNAWIYSSTTTRSVISVILFVSENYFILSVIHEMKVCQAI